MALQVEVGNFAKETTGTANATQTVTLVNSSITPTAVILWTSGNTSVGFTATSSISFGMGTGTGLTNQMASCVWEADNVTTNNAEGFCFDGVLLVKDGGGAPGVQGRLNALSAGSFQLIYPTNTATAYLINYMVLGGSDLTNAKLLRFAAPLSTGVRSDTGFGFQPDCVLFVSSRGATLATVIDGHMISLGAMTSASARWALAITGQQGQTVAANLGARSTQRTNAAIIFLNTAAPPTTLGIADANGMVSDGYSLNWTAAPPAAYLYGALALKGGQYAVGAFDKITTTGNQDVTTAGFGPTGLILVSRDQVSGTAVDGNSEVAIGGTDGPNSHAVSTSNRYDDNVLPTVADRRLLTNKALSLCSNPSTEKSVCTHTANPTGGFQLNWSVSEAVAQQILYTAFGSIPTSVPVGRMPSLRMVR